MEQDKNNKMPKFSMSWIYMLVIIGLISVYLMGGDSIGGSASKKVSYDEFRAYVTKGYASEIVLNKDESTLKMYVKAEHIRDVFKAGTKEVGKTPFVTSEFGSADKVESFVDAERQAGKFKGNLNYENKKGSDCSPFFSTLHLFYSLCSSGCSSCAAWAEAEATPEGVFNVGKSKANDV